MSKRAIRDRVKELRRVRAGDLRPHPKNWRTHSLHQRRVLRGLLDEVGMAGALLARELADGSLELVDGHLRAATAASAIVPVLVLDLDDAEAEKVLLTHDPLGALAGIDEGGLAGLLSSVATQSEPVGEMLAKLAREHTEGDVKPLRAEVEFPISYQVVVEVDGEASQRALYARLTHEGHRCRVLTL
ncbi:MAG: ParB N-terminal domain-containing protein [Lacipirellulaceae bacterium]